MSFSNLHKLLSKNVIADCWLKSIGWIDSDSWLNSNDFIIHVSIKKRTDGIPKSVVDLVCTGVPLVCDNGQVAVALGAAEGHVHLSAVTLAWYGKPNESRFNEKSWFHLPFISFINSFFFVCVVVSVYFVLYNSWCKEPNMSRLSHLLLTLYCVILIMLTSFYLSLLILTILFIVFICTFPFFHVTIDYPHEVKQKRHFMNYFCNTNK